MTGLQKSARALALVTSNEKLNSVRFETEPILAREKWI
jgi:hypothetical protein